MRVRTVVAAVLACSTFASAQPGADLPPPEEQPPPPQESAPPGTTLPPINITITNNNTGNNSNTNTQTNEQTSSQANPQTNTQTNSVPVSVTTSVTAAPGAVAPVAAPPRELVGRYELIKPHPTTQRWITLGFSRSGVRTSIDLLGRGPFTIGIAATVGGRDHHERGGHPDGGAVAYLAYTRKLGRFDVRASLGIGVGSGGDERDDRHADDLAARTTGTDPGGDGSRERHRRFAARAEAALLIGLPLTKRLGLLAGPVISASGGGHDGNGDDHRKPEVSKAVMAGLRFRF